MSMLAMLVIVVAVVRSALMAADDRSCRSWTPKVTVAAAVRVAVDVAAVTVGQGLAHESIMSQQPPPGNSCSRIYPEPDSSQSERLSAQSR
jgi:hypothetical protein